MPKPAPRAEPLDVDTLNSCLLKAEYAVMGSIAVKSQEYQEALKNGAEQYSSAGQRQHASA